MLAPIRAMMLTGSAVRGIRFDASPSPLLRRRCAASAGRNERNRTLKPRRKSLDGESCYPL